MGTNVSKKGGITKRTIHVIVMFILMFGIGMLPAPGAITADGMKILGAFAGMIYGWIFVEVGAPSLMGLTTLVLTGTITMNELVAGVYGSQIGIMFLMIFLFKAFIEEKNLGEVAAYWILSRKVLKGKPWLMFLFFMIACYIVGILTVGLVAVVIMFSILRSIAEIADFKPYSKEILAFVLGIGFTAVLGEMSLPTKGTGLVYVGIYTAQTGMPFDMIGYILVSVPMSLFIMICFMFLCKFIFRVDFSGLANAQEQLATKAVAATKEQKIALICIAAYMGVLLVPSLPQTNVIVTTISQFGVGGIALVLFGILMLIHVDHEPIINVGKIAKHFAWPFYFLTTSVVFMANFLTREETGVKQFLTDTMYPIVSNLGELGLVIVLFFMIAILTNFINNVVAGSLGVAMGIALAGMLPGLNLQMLTIMIAMAGMMAVATPAASPNAAYSYAQKDLVTARDMLVYGWISVFFLSLCTSVVGYFYASFIL